MIQDDPRGSQEGAPMGEWRFGDPENVATMTVRQITHGDQPILLVAHDA